MRGLQNRVRIIGGAWRGRLLQFSDAPGLRPTPDRVRETLFNWLGQQMFGKTCLDLFAGSGALGFEALSRGADAVVMIESDRRVHATLRENAERLKATNLDIVRADALEFLAGDARQFDVIFLDPPFHQNLLERLWPLLPRHLRDGGLVYVESETAPLPPAGWEIRREGRAGQVHYQLLRWQPDA